MANFLFPKGEVLHPYSVEMLEKTVAASGGVMKPGCKFKCTMYNNEVPNMWSLPCVFKGRYVTVDGGQKIRYRVFPGAIVWLLLFLPLAVLTVLIGMDFAVEYTGVFGGVTGLVAFAFTFQRMKAIARFEKRFGK